MRHRIRSRHAGCTHLPNGETVVFDHNHLSPWVSEETAFSVVGKVPGYEIAETESPEEVTVDTPLVGNYARFEPVSAPSKRGRPRKVRSDEDEDDEGDGGESH